MHSAFVALGWKSLDARQIPRPPHWLRVVGGITASTVFVCCALMWLATLVAETSHWGQWPVLFASVFIPFGIMMLDAVATRSSDKALDIVGLIGQVWRRVASGALLVVAIVCFWQNGFDGSPTIENGRHYISNHGDLTEITESQWRQAREAESRMFISGAMFFSGVAALY